MIISPKLTMRWSSKEFQLVSFKISEQDIWSLVEKTSVMQSPGTSRRKMCVNCVPFVRMGKMESGMESRKQNSVQGVGIGERVLVLDSKFCTHNVDNRDVQSYQKIFPSSAKKKKKQLRA